MANSIWTIINATLTYKQESRAWKLAFNYQISGMNDSIYLCERDVRMVGLKLPPGELTNDQLGQVIEHMCWRNCYIASAERGYHNHSRGAVKRDNAAV